MEIDSFVLAIHFFFFFYLDDLLSLCVLSNLSNVSIKMNFIGFDKKAFSVMDERWILNKGGWAKDRENRRNNILKIFVLCADEKKACLSKFFNAYFRKIYRSFKSWSRADITVALTFLRHLIQGIIKIPNEKLIAKKFKFSGSFHDSEFFV